MILGAFGPLQGILIIVIIGAIVLNVLYLLTLQNVLKQVGEGRRLVPAANVWLMFIPLFNIIYPFILYPKICDSIKAEYAHRGLAPNGDFGRSLGITIPILSIAGIIPFIGPLCGLANIVLFIVFWVKMSGYKNFLITAPKGAGLNDIGSSTELLDS